MPRKLIMPPEKKKLVMPPPEKKKKLVMPPEEYTSDYVRVSPQVFDAEKAFARLQGSGLSAWTNLLAMNDAVRGY
jgi:hypothetical protein